MKKQRYILILSFLVIFIPCLEAQKKEIQQAEAIIKSGKNLEKAEQQMRMLLSDSVNRRNLKIWNTMTTAVRAQYLQGNERMYLRQKQDTDFRRRHQRGIRACAQRRTGGFHEVQLAHTRRFFQGRGSGTFRHRIHKNDSDTGDSLHWKRGIGIRIMQFSSIKVCRKQKSTR